MSFSRLILIWLALAALLARAAGGQAATPPDSTRTTTTPRPRISWTADRLDLAVGDIVTVLIDERTLASAVLSDRNNDRRARTLAFNVQPPASGGVPAEAMAAAANFDNNADSHRSGQATRQNAFQSEMSARVVAVSPTGMVQLRGTKLVTVDKSRQEVEISGWIRPQDVANGSRTVPSYRLADAEITYVQGGPLGKPKSGIVSRILGMIWP